MPSIFRSRNLEQDFEGFLRAVFRGSNLILYPRKDIDEKIFKKFHSQLYCLGLLIKKQKRFSRTSKHRYVFLSELLSDSLTIPQLLIQGFSNAAFMLLRRVCENLFHHIYYYDHPIEFHALNKNLNEYVSMVKFKEYALLHPNFLVVADPNIEKSIQSIFELYQELCNIVHTKGINYMTLANNVSDVKSKTIKINDEFEAMTGYFQSLNYLLFRFHATLIFTNIEKGIISSAQPKSMRRYLFLA